MPIHDVPQEFLDTLFTFDIYHIIGHSDPDGDSLGSQLAMGSFLERKGKQVSLISPGPFRRNEINHLKEQFQSHIPPVKAGASHDREEGPKEAVLILDSASPERIGNLEEEIAGRFTLVIDHHSSGNPFGDLSFIDPTAPSVTYMVQIIIEALGEKPTTFEAELLLLGLVTDTGFFRHITGEGEDILSAASRLCSYGASPKGAYETMFGNRSLASRRLAGRVMDRARLLPKEKIIFTHLTRQDELELGEGQRDSDTIYGQLQSIEGVEGVVFFREEAEGGISVGLRSNSYIDMGKLASRFGGGGHPQAASFRSDTPREELEKLLTDYFRE